MSIRSIRAPIQQYGLIAGVLACSWFASEQSSALLHSNYLGFSEHEQSLLILFLVVIVFGIGFLVYELAKPTVIPSFVLAILFGAMTANVLSFLTISPVSVTTLITIGSVYILFSGGLEMPFMKFRQLLGPILSLAFFGTILNAFLLGALLISIGGLFHLDIPLAAAILFGAAIASTDPAAIIPSLQSLLFIKPRVKHIAISESAINDVVGAVLVTVFLSLFAVNHFVPTSIVDAYRKLFTLDSLLMITQVLVVGCAVGILSYGILLLWSKWKKRVQTESEADAALFLAVPLFAFTLASIFGGSGYLAVFVVGLLFSLGTHVQHVESYFNHTIEAFMKPMIFMLLGAMVHPADLLEVAGIGITAGILFMVVLRPLIVLISLFPFCFRGHCFSLKELLFLSFIRETGVIPAALLITIRLADIPGADTITAIGLWVILLTLIIEPPLTPVIAKMLRLAKDVPELPQRKHSGPVAVLCSRGYSFPERMETVVAWVRQHAIHNIVLLHCPEEKYSEQFVAEVHERADALFADINKRLENNGEHQIDFEFLSGPGMLQENIEKLVEAGDVSIIFVGTKMLDYRMDDVKQLDAPFFFMQ